MTDQQPEPEQHRINLGPGGNVDLDHLFSYHAPTPEQIPLYEALRAKGGEFARLIGALCPPGPDRSHAIRQVRDAVMWANAAIACEPPRRSEPEEPVEIAVTLPGGVPRCTVSSDDAADGQDYNRCVRSVGHDDPTANMPGTAHVDTWGVQWKVVDGVTIQIGALPREQVRQIIADEGTKVAL